MDKAAPPFAVGQIVNLKSGGPAMTVTAVERDAVEAMMHSREVFSVDCAWFDGAKAMSESFDARALVAAE